MSDQELDELFKNASEKYDAPYDPNDWERLAARLDKKENHSGFWNWKTYIGLSALVFIGTISSFLFITNDDELGTINNRGSIPVKESMAAAHVEVKSEAREKGEKVELLPLTPLENKSSAENKNIESVKNQNGGGKEESFSKNENTSVGIIDKPNSISEIKINQGQENSTSKNKEQSFTNNSEANYSLVKESQLSTPNKNKNGENKKESFSKNENTSVGIDKPNSISEIKVNQEQGNSTSKNKGQSLTDNSEANYSLLKELQLSTPNKNQNDENKGESFSKNEIVLADYKKSEDISLKHSDEKLTDENNSQQLSNKTNPLLVTHSIIDSLSETKKIESTKSVVDSVATTDTVKVVTQDEEKKKERTNHISLKLNLSPDYSSIGYYSPDKSGFNFGLMAEYSLTSHWSVSTGGIWTKKIYSGNDIAYPHNGKIINADYMYGNCRMLDWPINVNYYFTPTNRLGFYVSAGLSSYFMFNQSYTYEVNYGGSEYSYPEEIKQKESELFKMTNVSFGLQYKLNHCWSLQAEPFAKIPLAGVGEGKMKLVSSGVFFNLKYKF